MSHEGRGRGGGLGASQSFLALVCSTVLFFFVGIFSFSSSSFGDTVLVRLSRMRLFIQFIGNHILSLGMVHAGCVSVARHTRKALYNL